MHRWIFFPKTIYFEIKFLKYQIYNINNAICNYVLYFVILIIFDIYLNNLIELYNVITLCVDIFVVRYLISKCIGKRLLKNSIDSTAFASTIFKTIVLNLPNLNLFKSIKQTLVTKCLCNLKSKCPSESPDILMLSRETFELSEIAFHGNIRSRTCAVFICDLWRSSGRSGSEPRGHRNFKKVAWSSQ